MPFPLTIACPAKVNLHLEVGDKRPDGYHEIRSLMHTIGLYDYLTIKPSDAFSFAISDASTFPAKTAHYDLHKDHPFFKIYRQAKKDFAHLRNLPPAIAITLEKHIPIQAGLGGASSDIAGFLRLIATMVESKGGMGESRCVSPNARDLAKRTLPLKGTPPLSGPEASLQKNPPVDATGQTVKKEVASDRANFISANLARPIAKSDALKKHDKVTPDGKSDDTSKRPTTPTKNPPAQASRQTVKKETTTSGARQEETGEIPESFATDPLPSSFISPAFDGFSMEMQRWLLRTAAKWGSDVPFFLRGGMAYAYGRGEKIYPLPPLTDYGVLLYFPGIFSPTVKAYASGLPKKRANSHLLTQAEEWKSPKSAIEFLSSKGTNAFYEPLLWTNARFREERDHFEGIFKEFLHFENKENDEMPLKSFMRAEKENNKESKSAKSKKKSLNWQDKFFYTGMSGSGSSLFGMFHVSILTGSRTYVDKTRSYADLFLTPPEDKVGGGAFGTAEDAGGLDVAFSSADGTKYRHASHSVRNRIRALHAHQRRGAGLKRFYICPMTDTF